VEIRNIYVRKTGSEINFQHDSNGKMTKLSITSVLCIVASTFLQLWWGYRSQGFQLCYLNFQGSCHGNEVLDFGRKLDKIEHNIGPMHRTFQIFVASVSFVVADFNSVNKCLRDVAMVTKFYI